MTTMDIVNFMFNFAIFVLFGAVALRQSAAISALNARVHLAEKWLRRLQDWRDNVRSKGDE